MTPSIGQPTKPLAGFPTVEVADDVPLYRSTSTTNSPWWFGSDGTQRFDVQPPHGTCYLAIDIETAVRERGRERLLRTGMLSPAFVAGMNIYELRLPATIRAADTTDKTAVKFGANRELAIVDDYSVSNGWAQAFHTEGYEGIAYASRYTSGGQWNALALFGAAGDAGWGHVQKLSGRMALVDGGLTALIQEHPTLLQAPLKAAPPPLK